MDLSVDHRKMLFEESGIYPRVVEARGPRTIEKKMELNSAGFSNAQRIASALDVDVVATLLAEKGRVSAPELAVFVGHE
jgi:hypothetical protein